MSIGVYAYLRVKFVHKTPEIERTRYLFIIAGIFSLTTLVHGILRTFTSLPYVILVIGYLVVLLGYLITGYIMLKHPELVLITYHQILRSYRLYEEVIFNKEKFENYSSLVSVVAYLESIPKSLLLGITD
ncbi:MAG: hypothetical protein IH840_04995 [Candidatus Heimdallarchaeota archaeon]|nr:hypothetical protein [Candidatus Heimdallarchaeota archaeon]